MNAKEVLEQLESLGDEKRRQWNTKNGAGDKQFGVKMGDIRKVAKKIKTDHELALALWKTGNLDARLVAALVMEPKSLSKKELDGMVKSADFFWLADWVNSHIVKDHPDAESMRAGWMDGKHPWAARAGWNLTAIRAKKSPEDLDLPALLDRIEAEMADADPTVQWTMNIALVEIGIHHAKHRKRALAIGEKLGVYSDYPVRKGCTSPFAPIWIEAMVNR